MQLKITNNGKQNYSKICLEKSVHYITTLFKASQEQQKETEKQNQKEIKIDRDRGMSL